MGRGGSRSLQDPRPLRWGRSPSPHGARGVQCGTGAKGAGPEARGARGVRLFVGLGTVAPLCLAPHFPIGRAAGSSTGLGGWGAVGRGRGESAGAVCEVRPGHSEPFGQRWTAQALPLARRPVGGRRLPRNAPRRRGGRPQPQAGHSGHLPPGLCASP